MDLKPKETNKLHPIEEENEAELNRVFKILDKTEKEIKQRRDAKTLSNPEIFLSYFHKSREVYVETAEELINLFYIAGMNKIQNVMKKLLKGLQEQNNSTLKFALKYFVMKSEELSKQGRKELEQQKKALSAYSINMSSPKGDTNSSNNQEAPNTDLSHTKMLEARVQELENANEHLKNILKDAAVSQKDMQAELKQLKAQQSQQYSVLSPQKRPSHAKSHTPSPARSNNQQESPSPQKTLHLPPTTLAIPQLNTGTARDLTTVGSHGALSSDRIDLSQFLEPVKTEDDIELEKFQKDYEANKKALDNMLDQRLIVDSIHSAGTHQQLKSILYQLEMARRKAAGYADGDDDDEPTIDFDDLTGQLLQKFDKTQRKTAKKVLQQIDDKKLVSESKKMKDKKSKLRDSGTDPDPEIWEAEQELIRADIVKALEKREQDFLTIKEDYKSLADAYEDLQDLNKRIKEEFGNERNEKRETQDRLFEAKKEIESLESMIQIMKNQGKKNLISMTKNKIDGLKQSNSNVNKIDELSKEVIRWKKKYMHLKYQILYGEVAHPDFWDEDLLSDILTPITRANSVSKQAPLSSKRSIVDEKMSQQDLESATRNLVDDEENMINEDNEHEEDEEEVIRVKKRKPMKKIRVEEYSDPEDDARQKQISELEQQIKKKKKEVEERKKRALVKKQTMEGELKQLKKQATNLEQEELNSDDLSPPKSSFAKHSRKPSSNKQGQESSNTNSAREKGFFFEDGSQDEQNNDDMEPIILQTTDNSKGASKNTKKGAKQNPSSTKPKSKPQQPPKQQHQYQIEDDFEIEESRPQSSGKNTPPQIQHNTQKAQQNKQQQQQQRPSVQNNKKGGKGPISQSPPHKDANKNNAASAKVNASPASKSVPSGSNNQQQQQQKPEQKVIIKEVFPPKPKTRSVGVQVRIEPWDLGGYGSMNSPSDGPSTNMRSLETEDEATYRMKSGGMMSNTNRNMDMNRESWNSGPNSLRNNQEYSHRKMDGTLKAKDKEELLRIRERASEDVGHETDDRRIIHDPTGDENDLQNSSSSKRKMLNQHIPDPNYQDYQTQEMGHGKGRNLRIDDDHNKRQSQMPQLFTPQYKTSKPFQKDNKFSKLDDNKIDFKAPSMSKSTTQIRSNQLKMGTKMKSSDVKSPKLDPNSKAKKYVKTSSMTNILDLSDDEDLKLCNSGDIQNKVSPHFKSKLNEMILKEDQERNRNAELNRQEPPQKKMYRAMLNTAVKDPKIINMFKKYHMNEGGDINENGEFVPDYAAFHQFVDNFLERHKKCGADCIHLQRFYQRIGYYPAYQNRKTMDMKKKDMTNMPDKERHRYKLPLIPRQKKFQGGVIPTSDEEF